MKLKRLTILIIIIICITLSACEGDSLPSKGNLSQKIVGRWDAQIDVAKLVYNELSAEVGLDVTQIEVLCPVSITFNDDNTFVYNIDISEFSKALGECIEPYTSVLFGFDTGFFIDLIMDHVSKDIPIDSGVEYGSYQVSDDMKTVTIFDDSGNQVLLQLNDAECLEYYDETWAQTISFKKQ